MCVVEPSIWIWLTSVWTAFALVLYVVSLWLLKKSKLLGFIQIKPSQFCVAGGVKSQDWKGAEDRVLSHSHSWEAWAQLGVASTVGCREDRG